MQKCGAFLATLAVSMLAAAAPGWSSEAAHQMAERFASEPERSAAQAQRRADEAEMLARARAEYERHLAPDRDDPDGGPADDEGIAGETADSATEDATDPRMQALEAEREAEGRRLAERLEKARRARESSGWSSPPAVPTDARAIDDDPDDALSETAERKAERQERSAHVTILIAMTPGDRGIRRHDKTADPVICIGQICYVSAGPARPAERLSRVGALGTFNTLGSRAGSCNRSLTCVFRAVELDGAGVSVQPIDLRLMRHDRREARTIAADPTCRVERGRLICRRPVEAATYRLWVVPEPVAREAGPGALLAAAAGSVTAHRAALVGR